MKRLAKLAPFFALVACSSSPSFRIDNPTDHTLTVTIDGTDHVIAAQSDEKVSLGPGKHSLKAPAIGGVDFIACPNGKGGLINPELADYVIVNEVYKSRLKKSGTTFMPMQDNVDLDGMRYKGPNHLVSGLFIEEQWKYGVHEDFPQTETVSRDSGGNIYGKIFTAPEFVRYYRNNFGAPEPATTVTADLSTRKIRMLAPPGPLPDFANPEMNRAAKPLRDLYDRYIVTTSASDLVSIQKEVFALMQGLVTEYSKIAVNQPVSENQKYNDFVTQLTSTVGASTIILGPTK
jgi:hypothetical protein